MFYNNYSFSYFISASISSYYALISYFKNSVSLAFGRLANYYSNFSNYLKK